MANAFNSMLFSFFIFAIPFLLWPIALANFLSLLRAKYPRVLALAIGPYAFGWWLGLSLIAFPRQPFGFLAAAAILPAFFMLVTAYRAKISYSSSTDNRIYKSWLFCLVVGLAVVQSFQSLIYPTTGHDALVMELFSRHLAETWDFWSLPRKVPDSRGFQYPLTHPQALAALLAWFSFDNAPSWFARLPSTWAVFWFWLLLYTAAAQRSRLAGFLAVALLVSAPAFLRFMALNSQDCHRHLILAAAVVAIFAAAAGSKKQAALAGFFCGLGATYHNLQAPFVLLLPLALIWTGPNRQSAIKKTLFAFAIALITASPPYLANLVRQSTLIIDQSSAVPIATVGNLFNYIASARLMLDSKGFAELSPRLNYSLSPYFAGYVIWCLIAVILLHFAFRRWRLTGVERGLLLSSFLFLLVIFDLGNIVETLTRKNYWENSRYPQTLLPLAAVVCAVWLSGPLSMLTRRQRVVVALAACYVLSAESWTQLRLDAKLPQRDSLCITCDDRQKLAESLWPAPSIALQWLEMLPDARCLTFREAEYFAWSSLSGVTYFSPIADMAIAATTTALAKAILEDAGLNCVFLRANDSIDRALQEKHLPFVALAKDDKTLAIEMEGAKIWWWGDGQYMEDVTLPITNTIAEEYSWELQRLQAGRLTITTKQPVQRTHIEIILQDRHKSWSSKSYNVFDQSQFRRDIFAFNQPTTLTLRFNRATELKAVLLQPYTPSAESAPTSQK